MTGEPLAARISALKYHAFARLEAQAHGDFGVGRILLQLAHQVAAPVLGKQVCFINNKEF